MTDAHARRSTRTILVVEDDDDTRHFFRDLLEVEGYQIITVASGQTALQTAAEQPLDAVVLDYRLPDMSGIQVCRQLRALVQLAVPILVVTADHYLRLEADARAAG